MPTLIHPQPASAEPLAVLQQTFGYPAFRGQQEAVVQHVLAGNNALVLMPTGGGKSLCFQVPSLCRVGVGVVISPLIALMQDQVQALQQLGLRASAFNSMLSATEAAQTLRELREGTLDFLYLSPERLNSPHVLEALEESPLALFAVDEAHCVSQWGHDFRPEYQSLSLLKERFAHIPRLALTATADERTQQDIMQVLGLRPEERFLSSFDRPNIDYHVVPKISEKEQVLAFLKTHQNESGIIYCLSRKKVESTAEWLVEHGYPAMAYHAGLSPKLRMANQERFLNEEGLITVATIAFGMGINKPNVRYVLHLDLPKSIEAYYQETGRAGRDGLPSMVWMLYSGGDIAKIRRMISMGEGTAAHQQQENAKLDALVRYAEALTCRRYHLLEYFGESPDTSKPCNHCDICLSPPVSYDGTKVAQMALSCVYRTGQRFGVAHLIHVLIGEETDKVLLQGHEKLPTFGVGKALTPFQWKAVFRQLTALGLLEVAYGSASDASGSFGAGFNSIKLGASAKAVLQGKQAVTLREERAQRRHGQAEWKAGTAKAYIPANKSEEAAVGKLQLFAELKALRLTLAKEQHVPPFIIFNDATLLAMAERCPQSTEALATITGVGKHKLDRYGEAFLKVLQAF